MTILAKLRAYGMLPCESDHSMFAVAPVTDTNFFLSPFWSMQMSQDPGFNPYTSPTGPSFNQPLVPPAKSGAVTVVAILNFVFGALWLMCGILMTFAGGMVASFMPQLMEQAAKDPNMQAEQRQQLEQMGEMGGGVIGGIILAIGIVSMVVGLPTIIAGVGVMQRKSWGRILTIVIGCIAGIIALACLVQFNLCGVVIYAAYAATVLAILFNPRYAAEFA